VLAARGGTCALNAAAAADDAAGCRLRYLRLLGDGARSWRDASHSRGMMCAAAARAAPMRSPLGMAHTFTVLSALTVASFVLQRTGINSCTFLRGFAVLQSRVEGVPVRGKAAAVDAASVLRRLILV
jgi:hypothetical protein